MRCSFCGHESAEGALSCVACGNVFDATILPRPARPDPSPADDGAVARAAVHARWMLAAGAALSALTAVLVGAGVSSRFGVVPLADESLLVGALVMVGGWAQQVAARGAHLGGTVTPLRALWTWPWALGPLWAQSAPTVAAGEVAPGRVTLTGAAVAAAVLLRVVSLMATAGAVVVVSRLAWLGAAVATMRLVRDLTARQARRAELLRALEG